MQDLISAFGIDWRLLILQIINFAILLGALWYFLYKPVLKLLKDRETMIAKGVADAEQAAKEREAIEDNKATLLKQAEEEAGSIVAAAKEQGAEMRTQIVDEAKQHADALAKDASLKAEEMQKKAKKEAEKDIARLAVLAAEKVLVKK